MTSLDRSLHDQQMADMASFDEEMPSVGIFWYDIEEHNFFGVCKEELTPKMVEEYAAKEIRNIDITNLIPDVFSSINSRPVRESGERVLFFGRVSWNIDKFIVFVGKWAEPIQDELTTLIEDTFHLPYFEFIYDEHWDLGHGWSGDFK